jgi:cytoskeleton protein RodZ
MAGLLVLGIAGYVAWGYATTPDEEEPVETAAVAPPPEPTAPEIAPAVQPTAEPAVPSPSPTGAEASAPAEAAARPGPANAPASDGPTEAEDQVPPETELASAVEEVVEESPPQPAAADDEGKAGKIVIRARLESWIQITNDKKEAVFSRVLRAGETYTVPEEAGLMLTTGNAGGIEITVDGKKLKSLGTVGLVKRDIPLDPNKLKDGSAFKTTKAAPATD